MKSPKLGTLSIALVMTHTAFTTQTQRPPSTFLANANARPLKSTSRVRSFGNQPPDLDAISPDELVENLNAMGSAALSNISEEVGSPLVTSNMGIHFPFRTFSSPQIC